MSTPFVVGKTPVKIYADFLTISARTHAFNTNFDSLINSPYIRLMADREIKFKPFFYVWNHLTLVDNGKLWTGMTQEEKAGVWEYIKAFGLERTEMTRYWVLAINFPHPIMKEVVPYLPYSYLKIIRTLPGEIPFHISVLLGGGIKTGIGNSFPGDLIFDNQNMKIYQLCDDRLFRDVEDSSIASYYDIAFYPRYHQPTKRQEGKPIIVNNALVYEPELPTEDFSYETKRKEKYLQIYPLLPVFHVGREMKPIRGQLQTMKSRSLLIEHLSTLEGQIHLMVEDVVDFHVLSYVWNYLNGDDFFPDFSTLDTNHAATLWNYIRYFLLPPNSSIAMALSASFDLGLQRFAVRTS